MRSLKELAAAVGGEGHGDASLQIRGGNGLEDAAPGEGSFYGNTRYRKQLEATRASAVLVPQSADVPSRAGIAFVRVPNPHLAYAKISALFHPRATFKPGVSAGAHVHPEARVDASATVMAGATVEKGAVVAA